MIEHLGNGHGIVLRRDIVAAGFDDNFLRRAVQRAELVRIRQGAYVLAPVWAQADKVDRHRLLTSAVMQQYGDDVATSHTSACIEQGGPNWGLDLNDVHLTNLHGIGERRSARVIHHRGTCRVTDISRSDGHWITAPARTAVDTASIAGRDAGVCVLDWFVARGLATLEMYAEVFASMKAWPDTLGLHRMLQLCDGKAESIGESRSKLLFRDQGLPAPIPQFEIFDPSGWLAGRVDFAWPERRLMLEFDGLQKYLRLRRPGETLEQAIMREKVREDHLRELTGWMMIRLIWADLAEPQRTAARIWRAMSTQAA